MRHARTTRFVVRLAQAVLGLGLVSGQVVRADQQQAEQKKQIEQHARQLELQLRPFVLAQLELARSTCASLPAAVRREVAVAAGGPLRGIADEWAAFHFGVRRDAAKPPADPLDSIHEALAAALEPHVPAAEVAAFRREHAAAVARRARAARMQIVAKLDQHLVLSDGQRAAIDADLEKHWHPDWLVELVDAGHTLANNAPPAADFADRCIAPHLDGSQRAAWKEWSQKSGWNQTGQTRLGSFHALQMNSMHQPFPSDPWWTP